MFHKTIYMLVFLAIAPPTLQSAEEATSRPHSAAQHQEALSRTQQAEVTAAAERALAWLASQQQADGSFPTLRTGQPGVTSLCLIAFLARGYLPTEGRYQEQIQRGLRYVLSCQQPDGLLNCSAPEAQYVDYGRSHTGAYSHPITGLLLCESYGSASGPDADNIRHAIERAIAFTLGLQRMPKKTEDAGGWRYLRPTGSDSALSTTSWQVLFLRSARNAGFDVPITVINPAVRFVRRLYSPDEGSFAYRMDYKRDGGPYSRSMAAAGIIALEMSGEHQSEMALHAGQWILAHPFDRYNAGLNQADRFHYGAFYCSLAMFHLGGDYWKAFFPVLSRTLLSHQAPDGSWQPEALPGGAEQYGNAYTTAMAVLALSVPDQLLPIFQR